MESKKKKEKVPDERAKWIYIVADKDGLPQVIGKKRVPISYQTNEAKGEYDKYTDGARDAVVAALTKKMDSLRDFRHKQYVMAAKSLPVVE